MPPRFKPSIRAATEPVSRIEPAISKPRRASRIPRPDLAWRFGPRSEGVVKKALIKSAMKTGI